MSSASDKKPWLTLVSLSDELILSISDRLLPPDLICFSLCNKRLYHLLFPNSLKVTPTCKERLSFLERYEHDHPEYFTCDVCKILHRYDGSESFGLAAGRRRNKLTCPLRCVQSGQWTGRERAMEDHIWAYHAQPFSFLHLKLAMKRFRHGEKYGISLDSLLYKQVMVDNGSLFLFSRDAKICSKRPSLYIRRQNIIITSRTKFRAHLLPRGRLIPCFGADLYTLVQGVLDKLEDFMGVSFLYTCDMCNTDIEVEVRDFSPPAHRIAIIITRWTNLGSGITQEDELWKFHIRKSGEREENHACLFNRSGEAVEHRGPNKRDKIIQIHRATFEAMTRWSYEDLKFINLSYLRDGYYKYPIFAMTKVADNSWTIPFEESKGGLSRLWHTNSRRRFFHSSGKMARESVIADGISPTQHITTYRSRKRFFNLIFGPVEPDEPPGYSERPPSPPPPPYEH